MLCRFEQIPSDKVVAAVHDLATSFAKEIEQYNWEAAGLKNWVEWIVEGYTLNEGYRYHVIRIVASDMADYTIAVSSRTAPVLDPSLWGGGYVHGPETSLAQLKSIAERKYWAYALVWTDKQYVKDMWTKNAIQE